MSALSPESIAAYVQDYECLIEGILHFLRLRQQVAEQGNIDAMPPSRKPRAAVPPPPKT